MTTLLFFAGSARRDSVNHKLAAAAADIARGLGAEVAFLPVADYPLPLYDGDLESEQGIPSNVRHLRDRIAAADGLFIACPEYNGSITPLLKNLIDWTSRAEEGVAEGLVAYRGKVAALAAASPGSLGGIRGLAHVRTILSGIGVHVVPGDVAIGGAFGAFDEQGALQDDGTRHRLDALVKGLTDTVRALRGT